MRALLPTVALLACTPPEPEPFAPTAPTSACRAAPHDWVDHTLVGALVDVTEAPEFSLTKGLLEAAMRQAGLDAFTPVPYGATSYRVRYVTQDKGRTVEATAVITLPALAVGDAPIEVPTVLFAHGTTGFIDACAPSAGGIEDMAGAILIAAQGFAVVSPDYLGMNGYGAPSEELHPYLVAEPAAVGALDSVRAAWRFAEERPWLPASPTNDLLLWGLSEGGFTVLHADRLLTHYLPEARPIGTIAAVPPTDLRGLSRAALTELSPASGGLAGGLVGMASWHGDLSLLGQVLVPPFDTSVYEAMSTTCNPGSLLRGVGSVDEIFTAEAIAAARNDTFEDFPPFDCYLTEGSVLSSPVPRDHDAPVFLQISGEDELVLASVERDNAPRFCDAGYTVDYLECAGAGHVDGAAWSLPAQLAWARARAAGEPLTESCDFDDVRDCEAEFFDGDAPR
jgi:hypothetical protein